MIRFAILLLLLLAACAPAATTEDYLNDIDFTSSDIPVWKGNRLETQAVALEAVQGFDPSLKGAYIVVIQDTGLVVHEITSLQLEKQNTIVLLAFQDDSTVLVVLDLKDRMQREATAFSARLEVVITAALDAKFSRGRL